MSKQSNQRFRKEMEHKNTSNHSVSQRASNTITNSSTSITNNSPDGDYSAPLSTPSEKEL